MPPLPQVVELDVERVLFSFELDDLLLARFLALLQVFVELWLVISKSTLLEWHRCNPAGR